ncbi:MAG: T9SS type A sorting domain-containing protein [Bacteroidetes bacterium]|nr:T9SS type A sorting domain-containing protein [Bacteroidota bacterium]
MCPDDPSYLIYPDISLECEFYISPFHPGDSDTISYKIFIEQNGIDLELAQGVVIANHTETRNLNIQNYSMLCYNEPAAIRIDAVTYNGIGTVYKQYSYFISYKQGASCNYSAVTHGSASMLNQGIATFFRRTACSSVSSGSYVTSQYKVSFYLHGNFNLDDSVPVIQNEFTLGYNGALPNYQFRKSYIEYMNGSEIKFTTFVYELYNIIGQYMGWVPSRTDEASVVYKWMKKPKISNLTQFPVPLTPVNNAGIIQCYTSSGTDLSYEWTDSNDIYNMFSILPHGSCTQIRWYPPENINLNSLPPYEVYCRAFNSLGYSEWTKIRVQYSNNSINCPLIEYPDSPAGLITDNSILISSKFYEGEVIQDNYLLMNPLLPGQDEINFRISENAEDITYLDELKLLQAVTDNDREIAVTRKGEIISYKNSESEEKIILNNDEDVSDKLKFHDYNSAELTKDDKLTLTSDIKNGEAFVVLIPVVPVNKDIPAGRIILADGSSYEFFSRDNENVICIKLDQLPENVVTVEIGQNIFLDQLRIVKNEGEVKVSELLLIKAFHNNTGDISRHISAADGKYVLIDNLNTAEFFFKNIKWQNRNVRYLLKTTGLINKGDQNAENIFPDKKNRSSFSDFFLSDNIPNPFNPATVIRYSIPENGKVDLKVYDMIGKEVSVLVNEVQNKGLHEVEFNGIGLPSGIYFYRLEHSGNDIIKKMILIK